MAKGYAETDAQCREIIADARRKIFRPVYLLMGEEPFYPDMVCDAIIANALDDGERDFNQTVCYGADVTADDVITAARRYPMFAERQLVVVKEAQAMKSLEELAVYCSRPLESTVLVIYMQGASADKRKSLYKSVMKVGTVVESAPVRDYEISRWISSYYKGLGLAIDPDAEECRHKQAVQHIRTYKGPVGQGCAKGPESGCIYRGVSAFCHACGGKRSFHAFQQDTQV